MIISNSDTTIVYYSDSDEKLLALLIKASHHEEGIHFYTRDADYQQVAYMQHPENHVIESHYHNKLPRIIDYTCETIILRKGVLSVTLYEAKKELYSFDISAGDVLTLFSGGHGFISKTEVEMIEIKQGPFMGKDDKTHF